MAAAFDYRLMARYNRWMNDAIYEAASAGLSDADVREDVGAFFGSVLGTLNHLLVADIIWLKRFAGHRERYTALRVLDPVPQPTALNQIIHDDLPALRATRRGLDDVIVDWTQQIEPEDLDEDLAYANTKGVPFRDNFGSLLHHFFNHQTHHRGQVTTLLSQKGIGVDSTDLLVLIRS